MRGLPPSLREIHPDGTSDTRMKGAQGVLAPTAQFPRARQTICVISARAPTTGVGSAAFAASVFSDLHSSFHRSRTSSSSTESAAVSESSPLSSTSPNSLSSTGTFRMAARSIRSSSTMVATTNCDQRNLSALLVVEVGPKRRDSSMRQTTRVPPRHPMERNASNAGRGLATGRKRYQSPMRRLLGNDHPGCNWREYDAQGTESDVSLRGSRSHRSSSHRTLIPRGLDGSSGRRKARTAVCDRARLDAVVGAIVPCEQYGSAPWLSRSPAELFGDAGWVVRACCSVSRIHRCHSLYTGEDRCRSDIAFRSLALATSSIEGTLLVGQSTRLLHKLWHVVVTQAPAFSDASARRSSLYGKCVPTYPARLCDDSRPVGRVV